MIKFTKSGVFFVILIILFCFIEIFILQYSIPTEINEEIMDEKLIEEYKIAEIESEEKNKIWQIQIPKINLNAAISESTTKEVLNEYVGHFENTSREHGNVGLAAHNRGYAVNYFKDLKLLQQGDEIIYQYNNYEMVYEVEKSCIIRDTEWQYLEPTEENMLTLITCVENQPEYRRCIQAVEKEEEIY